MKSTHRCFRPAARAGYLAAPPSHGRQFAAARQFSSDGYGWICRAGRQGRFPQLVPAQGDRHRNSPGCWIGTDHQQCQRRQRRSPCRRPSVEGHLFQKAGCSLSFYLTPVTGALALPDCQPPPSALNRSTRAVDRRWSDVACAVRASSKADCATSTSSRPTEPAR